MHISLSNGNLSHFNISGQSKPNAFMLPTQLACTPSQRDLQKTRNTWSLYSSIRTNGKFTNSTGTNGQFTNEYRDKQSVSLQIEREKQSVNWSVNKYYREEQSARWSVYK